jgi:hypothetical protein
VDQVNYNWMYNTRGAFANQTVSGVAMNGNLGNLVSGTTITMNGSLTFEVDPASFTVTTVPKPGTVALCGLGAAGMFALRRWKARR